MHIFKWINAERNMWPACEIRSMVHVYGVRNLYANEFGLSPEGILHVLKI